MLRAKVLQTLTLFLVQFFVLGVTASAVGVVLALAGQQVLVTLIASVSRPTCAANWMPGFAAFCTGCCSLRVRVAAAGCTRARAAIACVAARSSRLAPAGVGVCARRGDDCILIGWQAGEVQAASSWLVESPSARLAALAAWRCSRC